MRRTGRCGRLQCQPCRKSKRGRSVSPRGFHNLSNRQCTPDPFDPRKRCTCCVGRGLGCSERTFGPEKEQRLRELRHRRTVLGLAAERRDETDNNPVGEAEASWGAIETVLTLGERFPEFPPELLVAIANEVVEDELSEE